MKVKFIIYTSRGWCRCFSLPDLEVNIRYTLKEHVRILAVERCEEAA